MVTLWVTNVFSQEKKATYVNKKHVSYQVTIEKTELQNDATNPTWNVLQKVKKEIVKYNYFDTTQIVPEVLKKIDSLEKYIVRFDSVYR